MTKEQNELNPPHWDKGIFPHRHLFGLKLGDLWHYKDLALLFMRSDFDAVYKQTILGHFDI